MKPGEQCPYITPCGWCSRKDRPCEIKAKIKNAIKKLPYERSNFEDKPMQDKK